MALIPDTAEIPRIIPSGQTPVARVRNAGAVEGAVADLFGTAADVAIDFNNRKIDHEVSSANTNFSIGEFELGNSFDQDEEYETMVDRYEKGARELLGQHAEGISSGRAQALFLEQQEARIAEGKERIKDKAWGVEVDFKRAEIVEGLGGLRELVINGQGIQAMEDAQRMIETGQRANYLSEELGTTMLQSFKHDSSAAWIKALPPEQQLAALKSPLAKFLPSEVHARLTRAAENGLLAQIAANTVDDYFEAEMTEAEMAVKADKIKDIKLREEVERRYNNEWVARDSAESRTRSDLFDKYFFLVRDNQLTVDQMKADPQMQEDLMLMGPEMQNQLFAAEGQPRTISDFKVIDTLHQYNEKVESGFILPQEMRDYFVANAHLLSVKDQNFWSQRSWDGVVPDEHKSMFAEVTMLNGMLGEAGYRGTNLQTARSAMISRLVDWELKIHGSTGKDPTTAEYKKKIDDLLMSGQDNWWFTGDQRIFEMSNEQAKERATELDPAGVIRNKVYGSNPNATWHDVLVEIQRATN